VDFKKCAINIGRASSNQGPARVVRECEDTGFLFWRYNSGNGHQRLGKLIVQPDEISSSKRHLIKSQTLLKPAQMTAKTQGEQFFFAVELKALKVQP
jgi:hypothetical protein